MLENVSLLSFRLAFRPVASSYRTERAERKWEKIFKIGAEKVAKFGDCRFCSVFGSVTNCDAWRSISRQVRNVSSSWYPKECKRSELIFTLREIYLIIEMLFPATVQTAIISIWFGMAVALVLDSSLGDFFWNDSNYLFELMSYSMVAWEKISRGTKPSKVLSRPPLMISFDS